MSVQNVVSTGRGHPWHGQPGWEIMEIRADSKAEADAFLRAQYAAHWHDWMGPAESEAGGVSHVLFRPINIEEEWEINDDAPGGYMLTSEMQPSFPSPI